MDIAKLNKKLAKMIKAATILEKHQDLNPAIKAWVEVSEMTLDASKTRDLDVSFRNMLIKKTEEIIDHIKFLKRKASGEIFVEQERQMDTRYQNTSNLVEPEIVKEEPEKKQPTKKKIEKERKDQDSKELPSGFKEIKPQKDFKIITPHDPEIVQQRLNQDIDFSVFAKKDEESEGSVPKKEIDIELDDLDPEGKSVCFACGYAENPPNTIKCKNCGVDLK